MHTLLAQVELKVNDKVGRFLVDPQASIAEVKEMTYMILKWVSQIEDSAKAQAEAKKAEEDKKAAEAVKPQEFDGSN